ncbi:MAG TPA: hypothetical protein PKI32_01680 [Opitutales bacterium]|nr:hypothetical protein [Opitutales bacterium]
MPFIALGILAVVAVIALFVAIVVGLAKLLHRMLASQDEASSGEEARLLQELNSKLGKLEKRIESLETIVTSVERGRGA